jgi:hypothetical protein
MDKSTVRRSVALPKALVEEALSAAPPALKGNLNSLVKEALRHYIRLQKALEFERAMESMAGDPEIQATNHLIESQFRVAESDGL